jgi:type IV pilus assembly protein PilC
MTYPVILLVVAIGATWALLVFALPNIVSMFSVEQMPWITNVMLKVSDFMASWKWLVTISCLVWLVFLCKFLYGNALFFKKFIDKMLLTIPVSASAVKTYYMYQFAQLLSQFYSAWISPIVSLWLMANIFSNFEYKKKMIEIKKDMAAWFTFYESMDWSPLFDAVFVQIMHVWEDTWAIWEVLARISKFYMNQFSDKMDTLMALLEPAMMVLMAWLIWSIVAAIYLPMVSVMEVL